MTITQDSPATIPGATPVLLASPEPSSRPAILAAKPILHSPGGPDFPAIDVQPTPSEPASRGTNVPGPAAKVGAPTIPVSLLDPALCLAADVLDDIERVRTANENRVRQLTRTVEDSDGEERGFGLAPDHPDVIRLVQMVEALSTLEHQATLELQRRLRKGPFGAFQKANKGIGEKQLGRLLAAIGDPYINSAKGEPRTVSALWAYSGLHVLPGGQDRDDAHPAVAAGDQHRGTDQSGGDAQTGVVGVAAKRKKGQRANWSTKAKMRAYLVAQKCSETLDKECKASRNPEGPAWAIPGHLVSGCRDGHVMTDGQNVHAVPAQAPQDGDGRGTIDPLCSDATPSCGCSPYRVVYDQRRAHTATTHPEWTDGHSHNDALRVASKAILRDLWRAARDWHQQNGAES